MILRHIAISKGDEEARGSQQVYRVGADPDGGDPTPPGYSGELFERDVHAFAARTLNYARDKIRLRKRAGAGDRGIDISIHSTVPFSLFGLDFTPRNGHVRVALQCKYTTLRYASLEKISHSVAQAKREGIDHFVLLTNKTITPKTHFTLAADLADLGIAFDVVEGARLAQVYGTPDDPGAAADPGTFRLDYQFERSLTDGAPSVDLYFLIRNCQDSPAAYELVLDSDHDWVLEGPGAQGALGAYGSRSGRLLVRQRKLGGMDDLVLHCKVDQATAEIVLSGEKVRFDFVPRFFGQRHRRILGEMVALVDDLAQGKIVLVRGAAGCGKSRITDELYRRRGENDFQVHVIKIDETTTLTDLLMQLARFGVTAPQPTLDTQIEAFSRDRLQTLLILDDLHNARREILQAFLRLIVQREPIAAGVCLILSGRDDFTFENPHYIALLESVRYERERGHPGLAEFEVLPFTDSDARGFIRATVRDLPSVAEEAIFRIGQNIPFNLIHAFEHILERRFAHIANANTIAISNLSEFLAHETLPTEIADLLERRLDVLSAGTDGERIRGMLLAASYIGITFEEVVIEAEFGNGDSARQVLERLVNRKFLIRMGNGTVAFAHENIRSHLRGLLSTDAVKQETARQLLRWHGWHPLFDWLRLGELHLWAGDPGLALRTLQPVLSEIDRVQNVSANQIDFGYFDCLEALFEAGVQEGLATERLEGILLTRLYMAIHNYSPQRGVLECETALQVGRRIGFDAEARGRFERTVQQMKAHALINTGRLMPAYGIMKELETDPAFARATTTRDVATAFDLNNRLHDLYAKWNHVQVARNYIERATHFAHKLDEASRDGLLALQYESEARLHLQRSPQTALEKMEQVIVFSRRHAPFRNNLHNELTLRVSRAYVQRENKEGLLALIPEVEDIQSAAIQHGCTGSIPRSYLLLATLVLATSDAGGGLRIAQRLAENGINSSLRLGYLTYLWLLYNLRAVCTARIGGAPNEALRFFNTAVDCMTDQDLLFLGNLDNCYPNVFVLSNYCGYLLPLKHETGVYRFLRTLRCYDQRRFTDQAELQAMLGRLRETGVLFGGWRTEGPGALRDTTGLWLPLH